MSTANLKALVQFRLQQAEEALGAATTLKRSGFSREVVNRAYYAMFYAVLALLAVKKKETSKHHDAIGLFDLEFVKPGTFGKEFSEWLHAAFNLRLRSDYAPMFQVSQEQAEAILDKAGCFVAGVKSQLEQFLSASDEANEHRDRPH